jgi:hypothetical protein
VLEQLSQSEAMKALGVEMLTFAVLAIKATPEMSRALEAEARELLLRQADNAIYDRRNSAVEQERRIKENELNTEIAVEDQEAANPGDEGSGRPGRRSQGAGNPRGPHEWADSSGRGAPKAGEAETANARAQADVQAYAVEATLRPLAQLDPKPCNFWPCKRLTPA